MGLVSPTDWKIALQGIIEQRDCSAFQIHSALTALKAKFQAEENYKFDYFFPRLRANTWKISYREGKMTLRLEEVLLQRKREALAMFGREGEVRWMLPHHRNKPHRGRGWVAAVVWRQEGRYVEMSGKGGRERGKEGREGGGCVRRLKRGNQRFCSESQEWCYSPRFLCDPIDLILDLHLILISWRYLFIMSPSDFNWSISLAQSLAGFISLELGGLLSKKRT